MQEKFHRRTNKILAYPVVVLSAVASVLSSLSVSKWLLAGINIATMSLAGLVTTINPTEKAMICNQVGHEFEELAAGINQFIYENNKTKEELKNFSQVTLGLMETWSGLSPPVRDSYVQAATRQWCKVPRVSRQASQV